MILSRKPHLPVHLIQTCVFPHVTQTPKGRIRDLDLKVPVGPKKVHNPTQTNRYYVEYSTIHPSNLMTSGGLRCLNLTLQDHPLEGFYCNLTVNPSSGTGLTRHWGGTTRRKTSCTPRSSQEESWDWLQSSDAHL